MSYILILEAVVIIYLVIYYVYYKSLTNKYEIYREKVDVSPAIAGFMYNENSDGFSLMLSTILSLVKKGYLKLDYIKNETGEWEYIFSKQKETFDELKPYEMISYNLLFSNAEGDKISLRELEAKIKSEFSRTQDARVKTYALKLEIKEEMIEQGILNENRRKKMKKGPVFYIILLLIIALISFLMYKTNTSIIDAIKYFIPIYLAYICIYRLYRFMTKYTKYGKEELSKIHGYARFLKAHGDFKEKELAQVVLWEDIYVYATAFSIPVKGMEEFIGDEVRYGERKNAGREMLISTLKKWWIFVIGIGIYGVISIGSREEAIYLPICIFLILISHLSDEERK